MEKKEIANLKLHVAKPTKFNMSLLLEWVIWQFPKNSPESNGFCGATHPPIENHGWLPAIVQPQNKEVIIYGQVPEPFETPELAAEFFTSSQTS